VEELTVPMRRAGDFDAVMMEMLEPRHGKCRFEWGNTGYSRRSVVVCRERFRDRLRTLAGFASGRSDPSR